MTAYQGSWVTTGAMPVIGFQLRLRNYQEEIGSLAYPCLPGGFGPPETADTPSAIIPRYLPTASPAPPFINVGDLGGFVEPIRRWDSGGTDNASTSE